MFKIYGVLDLITINKDLGFSNEDRIENNRRVAHLAKLISDSGVFAIVSTVSPSNEIRSFSRELHDNGKYIEVFINASIEECIKRDPKNLYGNTTKKTKILQECTLNMTFL